MIELVEKSVMTMLGAATLTQKKSEELLKDLREKLNVSEQEGKDFLKRLQTIASESQDKLQKQAREEVRKACERMGVVSVDEFEKLKKKVAKLEKKAK